MFEPMFMRLAFLTAVAVGASLGLMGVYLVIRRVIFLGLVLANAAAVGVALAELFQWSPEISSIAAAVATALGLGTFQTLRRTSAESIMGWAYAAASSATVLILAGTAGADMDTLHLLYGSLLAVSTTHAVGLFLLALAVGGVHVLFGRRFLLVTLDPEGARVAGVKTPLWSLCINLLVGVVAAAAVHEIGALLTFSLLTLAPTASLLATRNIRSAFAASAGIGVVLTSLGLVVSFHFDLPPGPASVALLALSVPIAAVIGRRQEVVAPDDE
jgi:ABC-type Mn2+/Zn2+ transport system permease subunit